MKKKSWIIEQSKVFCDDRGKLLVVESPSETQEAFQRMYCLHFNERGQTRGHHAHKNLIQKMIVLKGQVRVCVDNGVLKDEFILDENDNLVLKILPVTWRVLESLRKNCILAVLARDTYDETDYIRRYEDFQKYVSYKC